MLFTIHLHIKYIHTYLHTYNLIPTHILRVFYQCTVMSISIHWTGLLDWITGLDYWTGLLDWITGLDYWNGLKLFFVFLPFIVRLNHRSILEITPFTTRCTQDIYIYIYIYHSAWAVQRHRQCHNLYIALLQTAASAL